jgi:two-component system sensor histidine kinase HydH
MNSVNLSKRGSLIAAVAAWALLCLLALFIIWGYRDRARLIRDNENERILNTLFTSVRDYEDFGSAITASETLRDRITGFAVYGADTALIHRWGKAPDRFDPALLEGKAPRRFNRYTISDRRGGSIKFVIHNERPPAEPPRSPSRIKDPPPNYPVEPLADRDQPPEPPGDQRNAYQRRNRQGPWFFSAFTGGNYVYIDLNQAAYWNTMLFTAILYPVCVIVFLLAVIAVRLLYLRNVEYRERIDAQQSLVILGTAASTLAHEIKNPLHSIKLQTGILKKIAGGLGDEEIARIEEEVNRLAALTYQVNDYLRDPAGNPETINIAEILDETSRRIRGVPILPSPAGQEVPVFIDTDRIRSVFENIIRNALEAGGPGEAIRARVKKEGGKVHVVIEDRGRGIAQEDLGRVFDPFYTSKSTGTGIGLAISRRFVEAAGGGIVLENRSGGGVAVRITLPQG